MDHKVFINKHIEITNGDQAEKLMNANEFAPQKFFEEEVGVRMVNEGRWLEAQHYERKTWCDSPARGMVTDRNEEHKKLFGDYKSLNFSFNQKSLNIIELGCGPFTNLRLILPEIFKPINNIDLLDPLISEYVKHTTNCTYKTGAILGRKVNLINSPIEKFESTKIYDLIIMINVLEHCYDLDLIFDKILNMMDENSIFIFEDDFFNENYIKHWLEYVYDAGHPIQVTNEYINKKLKKFKKLFKREILTSQEGRITKYYILKKK